MRLTCPNCGADYDVPGGMVPGAGRHVQCSACHTRWFVRGSALAAASEEQILTRLESWRPRPVAVPAPEPAARAGAEGAAVTHPRPAEPLRVVPTTTADNDTAPVVAAAGAEPAPAPESAAARPSAPPPPSRERPAKPADRPSVTRPTPVPDAPVRPAPRLDLHGSRAQPEPAPPPRSRFLHGLLLVLIAALIAFGTYRFADPIAATVPAAAPAFEAYAGTIDGWREDVERLIAPYRSREGG